MSGHDAAAVLEAFLKQQEMMKVIYALGMQEYVKGLMELGKTMDPVDHTVRCIDEGTPGGFHLAGSGILLGLDKAAEALKRAGAEAITSHAECGAAGIYARANKLDPADADTYGKEFAVNLAEKTGLPYLGHIEIGQMKRPSGFHVARAAYYDGSGKFNCSASCDIPAGFVVSRKFIDAAYALEEIKVCISIATGDHGFGELITPDTPFLLVAIGDVDGGQFGVESLKKELAPLEVASGGKVKVDGFVAP